MLSTHQCSEPITKFILASAATTVSNCCALSYEQSSQSLRQVAATLTVQHTRPGQLGWLTPTQESLQPFVGNTITSWVAPAVIEAPSHPMHTPGLYKSHMPQDSAVEST